MCDDEDTIKVGEFVLIQRQGFMKLKKLKEKCNVQLGKFVVELDNIIGNKYFEYFQMKPKGGKMYTVQKVTEIQGIDSVSIERSGEDNRDIKDDSNSQTLSKEEIEKLQDETNSTEILGKLVAHSKTFNSKTGYSQEKYLKKKQKKYFDYICVRRPTIRLLATTFYKSDPYKLLGMRIDDLSQILTYSNVQSEGIHLLYDSGTMGLMPAAVLNAIGANTPGKVVYLHPGNEWQKNAFLAMQFPQEQSERLINVNIYSVLRWYHQQFNSKKTVNDGIINDEKKEEVTVDENVTMEIINDEKNVTVSNKRKLADDDVSGNERKKPCWHFDNEKACALLAEKVDSIIIVCKEHPVSIVTELLPFLKQSRNLVVFNYAKEPLQDLYLNLKSRSDFVNVLLVNNFMRQYQVLPERTHPVVNMNFGGYILYGTKTT